MRVLTLTSAIGNQDGWARYSQGLTEGLDNSGVRCEVVVRGFPLLRAQRANCIHALVETYATRAYWLSILTRRPYFITVHGTFGLSIPLYVLKRASAVVCVSQYTERVMLQRGITNTIVIHNGIDVQRFCREVVPREQRKEKILTVGAVKPRKGAHLVIEALGRISEQFPNLVYEIVGDQSNQEYLKTLRKRVVELGLENRVLFIPPVSDDALIQKYSTAVAFVMTSVAKKHAFEGFGLVYLEANACGTPVVGALDTGGEDAIRSGETGYLVPQGDVRALATALTKLLTDREGWANLSSSGQEWARKHDWRVVAGEYARLYRQ